MSRSASGALLAWTDQGGLSSSQRLDVVRIALRLAGYEPRVGGALKAGEHDALVEALLPPGLRPTKKDRQLSLERCVSVMLGGCVPEDKVLTRIVNKVDKHGNQTANAWQEHVTSKAVRNEYYISEAIRARAEIRAWAQDEARRRVVFSITGCVPDPTEPGGDDAGAEGDVIIMPGAAEEAEATPSAPPPARQQQQQQQADAGQPVAVARPAVPVFGGGAHAQGAAPAAPKVALTLGGAAPRADKASKSQPAAASGVPHNNKPHHHRPAATTTTAGGSVPPPPPPVVLPPAPLLSSGIRVRIEVNDEMFTVGPADLHALGLDAGALAAWYARKAGRPVPQGGPHGSASPSAVKLAAARQAVMTGGALGEGTPQWWDNNAQDGSPRGRGVKRLSDALAALAGPSAGGGSPQSDVENMPPPGMGALPGGAAAIGDAAGAGPAAKKLAGGACAPATLPVLQPEHERAFSAALLSLTGHRGECAVTALVHALEAAMPAAAVQDCLKVFEANNKLLVADSTVFIT